MKLLDFHGLRFFILLVAFFIGSIVFCVNTSRAKATKSINTRFDIMTVEKSFWIKRYSGEEVSLRLSSTFSKLLAGIISSMYFGVTQLWMR